jgi:putative transposase
MVESTVPDSRDGLLTMLAGRLAWRSEDLVERQIVALRQFGAYDRVPEDDLRRSCQRNVARVVAVLEQRDQLPPGVVEDERMSGRRRALQGVPTEDVVEAYRVVLSVLRDAFVEEAGTVGADPRQVMGGVLRLWELTDRYSNVLVSARQQVEIEAARRDERHRMAFLLRLLMGADPVELVEGGAVHGVLSNRTYWVFRGRQHDGATQRLSRHLEEPVRGSRFRPLVAPLDDDVVGVGTRRPEPLDAAVVAVAGPVALSGVAGAFAEATRVFQVALRYGRGGVVDSSSLSVRLAVEQHQELGEQLYRRYVADRLDRGSAGAEDLLRTLQAYLASGRSVATAARDLSVHENTVRYRLDRYQALTGTDLGDTDTVVELWWALEYMRIRPG